MGWGHISIWMIHINCIQLYIFISVNWVLMWMFFHGSWRLWVSGCQSKLCVAVSGGSPASMDLSSLVLDRVVLAQTDLVSNLGGLTTPAWRAGSSCVVHQLHPFLDCETLLSVIHSWSFSIWTIAMCFTWDYSWRIYGRCSWCRMQQCEQFWIHLGSHM